ncbi:MAG TPA: hypothetical protein VGX92_12205 [Pyrinomonadaceae bacterium]|nr:hypothetical protein [Pyrinomonadaceae bacterium]
MRIPRRSFKRGSLLLLLMLLTAALMETTAAAQSGRREPFEIKSMQARLFMSRDGSLGEDLFASDEARILWNIGVHYSSDSVLVIVEIAGPPDEREPYRRLALTATSGRRVLLNGSVPIYNFFDDARYHAAFIVHGTGCEPVKLTARILGQRKPATMTRLINFQCGE